MIGKMAASGQQKGMVTKLFLSFRQKTVDKTGGSVYDSIIVKVTIKVTPDDGAA